MCSLPELQDDETRGTGCGYDTTMLWSASECAVGFSLTKGSSAQGLTTSCEEASSPNFVRCCADAPTLMSCGSLGWNPEKFGNPEVCGESDTGLGGCSGFLGHDEAELFCEAGGARLCSLQELADDETRGTGCGYDFEQVWSATSCGPGLFSTAMGSSSSGKPAACEAGTVKRAARCCSRIATAGGVDTNDGDGTPAVGGPGGLGTPDPLP